MPSSGIPLLPSFCGSSQVTLSLVSLLYSLFLAPNSRFLEVWTGLIEGLTHFWCLVPSLGLAAQRELSEQAKGEAGRAAGLRSLS